MKIWFAVIFHFLSTVIFCQDISLNSWRSHFSYSEARIIEQANETLFCATTNGLFSIDLELGVTEKLSKEYGLGDVGVTAMHYAQQVSTLVIGYESGVIDLIDSDGSITTITTIRDSQIVSEKSIRSITSSSDHVFVATDFGVVFLDLTLKEVKENYRNIGIGGNELAVQEILIQNDSIYILAEDGIRAGYQLDNLLDYNSWVTFSETSLGGFEHLISNDGNLYSVKNQVHIWKFDGEVWVDTGIAMSDPVVALYEQNGLLALTATGVYSILPTIVELITDDLLSVGNDLILDKDDYWVADGENGLLKITETTDQFLPDGLLNDNPTKIKSLDGKTYAFYGPLPSEYNGISDGLGFSVFEDGRWSQEEISGYYNLSDVALIGNRRYFASVGFGLYDEQNDEILNQNNSIFTASDGTMTVELSAIEFYNNSLWILSYDTDNPLYQFLEDGSLEVFSSSKLGSSYPRAMEVSSEGVLWVIKDNVEGGGITAFDPSLELQRTINTSDNLPSLSVTGISIDSDDETWISTAGGVANFNDASFPFIDYDVSIPIFQNGFLFEDEVINDVMTDGGGRIWFATENGAWLLTKDLTEVVDQFTIDNSPLPSNTILQFSYNDINGEIFILTDKGLVSYRSISSAGGDSHESEITIFPNPVLPNFSGLVGFSGLVRNASLKITDSRGRLIKELIANGGTASWDLRTFNQSRVKTGVYLVFSSSDDGTDTLVGKIAVIK